MQDLYVENCKILLSKVLIKKFLRNGGISHGISGKVNTVKMSVLSKLIYRFSAIAIKIPARYLVKIKTNSIIYMVMQRVKLE